MFVVFDAGEVFAAVGEGGVLVAEGDEVAVEGEEEGVGWFGCAGPVEF